MICRPASLLAKPTSARHAKHLMPSASVIGTFLCRRFRRYCRGSENPLLKMLERKRDFMLYEYIANIYLYRIHTSVPRKKRKERQRKKREYMPSRSPPSYIQSSIHVITKMSFKIWVYLWAKCFKHARSQNLYMHSSVCSSHTPLPHYQIIDISTRSIQPSGNQSLDGNKRNYTNWT